MRMKTDRLDLLQFHWWDYNNNNYYDAVANLMKLQEQNKIKNIGLTNFDSYHMNDLIVTKRAPIISNQVSFSVLDTRPKQFMISTCEKNGVKLLTYGTLLGGFLSEKWLDKPDPSIAGNDPNNELSNVSLRKYLPWIQYWGGWSLFQELLAVLNTIAKKHSVSIANVALKWVLDQPAVGGGKFILP